MAGRRAIVLGLGRFGGGHGVARWLLDQGADVLVTDLASEQSLGEAATDLARRGAQLVLGGHDGVDVEGADLLVVNPAVPLTAPLVQRALSAGVTVTSEVALLMERWPGPVVGVTGSNGKSTTVSLTQAILVAAGQPALAGGNLGGSLLDRLDDVAQGTVAVLELSSFMLETLELLGQGPDVALITNITPNHLDRHDTFDSYRDAKAAVMARAHTVVLNADDPVIAALAPPTTAKTLWFGDIERSLAEVDGQQPGSGGNSTPRPLASGGPTVGPDVGVDPAGNLRTSRGELILSNEAMPLPGRANRLDLAAAALAATALVGQLARVVEALPASLQGFRLPPHRLETVSTAGGIRWIDDSVSTTPESTAASLAALAQQGCVDPSAPGRPAAQGPGPRCLLIAGGHDKGLDAGPLVDAASRHAAQVLTIGEEGRGLGQRLTAAGVSCHYAETLARAVTQAADWAREGDCVLLSPGYSSHDQFVHFAARGQAFRDAVNGLQGPEPLS